MVTTFNFQLNLNNPFFSNSVKIPVFLRRPEAVLLWHHTTTPGSKLKNGSSCEGVAKTTKQPNHKGTQVAPWLKHEETLNVRLQCHEKTAAKAIERLLMIFIEIFL